MRKLVVLFILLSSCAPVQKKEPSRIDRYLSQYAPYEMFFDASQLPDKDKMLLKKLIAAAEYLDTLYWKQTSLYGKHVRDSLSSVKTSAEAGKLLTLVKRNAGVWDQLNDFTNFLDNRPYYPGGELYPEGMTALQFDDYLKDKSEAEKKSFMSPYTVIQKDGKGGYRAVPYHEVYSEEITKIARLLNECADLTDNASFANFLKLKAKALQTDEYFDADVAWIDMVGSPYDIVFGPFETYSDGIKGVKAKYEANVEIIDQEESGKLDLYTKYLKEFEANLPVDEVYKSNVEGLTAKFVIVRDIIRAGESATGYQAVATNLPNDPEVHAKKGTKKTFWKNMFVARFNTIIRPVSERLIDSSQLGYLSDQGFFQFVLMHEICHAVGPRKVKTGLNKGLPVNASVGPLYNALEEGKADLTGLHSLMWLMDHGVVEKEREKEFIISYLGSLFRSIRFGTAQAHGKAALYSLNYYVHDGSVTYDGNSKRWKVNFELFRKSVSNLTAELIVLEGDGDPVKLKAFFDRWVVVDPNLSASLSSVEDLPTDVIPTYSTKWD